jgi:Flp pilus assembly protein TadB
MRCYGCWTGAAMERSERPAAVEERLRRRERALGWAIFGLLAVSVFGAIGLALLALPLLVVAFPLTLSAVAVILVIGYVRSRRTRD